MFCESRSAYCCLSLTYLKNMLKVKKSSCNNAIYAECGRFPLLLKQKVQVLKYWERILHLDLSHLVKEERWCIILQVPSSQR